MSSAQSGYIEHDIVMSAIEKIKSVRKINPHVVVSETDGSKEVAFEELRAD